MGISADVNSQGENGTTPLHTTYPTVNAAFIEPLMDTGADINLQDESSRSPLQYAMRDGAVVKLVLDAGADVNYRDRWGERQLHAAYYQEQYRYEGVKFLLEAGAEVNCRDEYGRPPLFRVFDYGGSEMEPMAEIFILHGAVVDLLGANGRSALFHAANPFSQVSLKRALDNCTDVKHRDNLGRTSLFLVPTYPNEEVFKPILEAMWTRMHRKSFIILL